MKPMHIILIVSVIILVCLCGRSFYIQQNYDIACYVINLRRATERLENFKKHATFDFKIIEAVDKKDHATFPKWPCRLDGPPRNGYKALQLSTIKTLRQAIDDKCEWAVIFEDDAEPPKDFIDQVHKAIEKHPDSKCIYLDKRNQKNPRAGDGIIPQCCAVCVMYHKSIFGVMIRELNPVTSTLMREWDNKRSCLSDWFIPFILQKKNIKTSNYPIVPGNKFTTQVS